MAAGKAKRTVEHEGHEKKREGRVRER